METELPKFHQWNKTQTLDILIHSYKAYHKCEQDRKLFELCRSTPDGRYANPEKCKDSAESLISCFSKV